MLPGPEALTVQLSANGLGEAGSVDVPSTLWAKWAHPMFHKAGALAPKQDPTTCPNVEALMSTLETQGLVRRSSRLANARAFVKWKSLEKCVLIIDMRHFNGVGAQKPRPFQLPTVEKLAALLRTVPKGAWSPTIDLANWCWSIRLPPILKEAVRVAWPVARMP